MKEEIIYEIDNQKFKGYLVNPFKETNQKKPAILISPTWLGRNAFAHQKAEEIAELGYIAFVVDLYGEGKEAKNEEEAGSLMKPLFMDRHLLKQRMSSALEVLVNQPNVDGEKIGAIGFCFGGLTVIELLRSGANVKGVVSFHGVLGSRRGNLEAETFPIAKSIKGSLLVLHGYKDPLVSSEDIHRLQKEMNEANVDWQFHTYGLAGHSFTNPDQHDKKSGLFFESRTAVRAWESMKTFFREIF